MIQIQIINKGRQPLPTYATPQSAGMDLRANIDEPIVLHPMERRLVPTGLYMALPAGFEAQIRPRSGLALKHGITVLNTPGMQTTVAKSWCCSSTSRRRILLSTRVNASPKWSSPSMSKVNSWRWKTWMRRNVVLVVMDILVSNRMKG